MKDPTLGFYLLRLVSYLYMIQHMKDGDGGVIFILDGPWAKGSSIPAIGANKWGLVSAL